MTTAYVPQWLKPSQPGMLSNRRGANTGLDSIAFQIRYTNPRGAADAVGTMRILAQRVSSAGIPQTPSLAWDSGWIGQPNAPAVPTILANSEVASFVYGGRLYAALRSPTQVAYNPLNQLPVSLYSTLLTGASLSTWRQETSILWTVGQGVSVGGLASMCVAAGRVYACDHSGHIAYATLNADGTVGSWTTSTSMPAAPGALIGGTFNGQGWLAILGHYPGLGGGASTNVQNVGLNADGSLQSWVAGTALPAARGAHAVFYNADNGYVVVVGGQDATPTVQATVWHAPVTGLGAVGAWVLTDQAIPAARNAVGLAFDAGNSTLWVVGGDNAGAQGSVYNHAVSTAGAITGAWATLATPRPSPAAGTACAIAVVSTGTNYLISAAGTGSAATYIWTGTAWLTGLSAGMTAGNLGSGGAIGSNADGTQDITILYGAVNGPPTINGFTDGDQVLLAVQFTDAAGGDPSPVAYTVIKIGQPPTIGTPAPSGALANQQPQLSFFYLAGAGGGPQASWRAVVRDTNGMVIRDTGVRNDQQNSDLLLAAPMLPNAACSHTLTVASTDVPIDSNSTNQASLTTNFTPGATAPAPPTGVTATLDATRSGAIIAWTNPGGATPATHNRIYYRRKDSPYWMLLQDMVPAQVGLAMSVLQIDQLAMGVTYEFAVSAVSFVGNAYAESDLVPSFLIYPDFETPGPVSTVWQSIGTSGTGNLNAWPVLGGATIAANVVTLPSSALMYGGHPLWSNLALVQWRFNYVTNSRPELYVNINVGNGTAANPNNWVRARVDGASLLWDKLVGGQVSNALASVACALVTGTNYWMQIVVTGTTFQVKVFNDNAGAINLASQVGTTLSATITDPSVQSGYVGIGNGGNGGGSSVAMTAGGAFVDVLKVQQVTPAGFTVLPSGGNFTAGEPAFAYVQGVSSSASNSAHSGSDYVSVWFSAAGQVGSWLSSPNSAWQNGTTYAISAWGRSTSAGQGGILESSVGGKFTTGLVTAAGAWQQFTANWNSDGTSTAVQLLGEWNGSPGSFDWDDLSISAANLLIAAPVGGYTAMLHIQGQGQNYNAPLMLQGGPQLKHHVDAVVADLIGRAAPGVRYGVEDYFKLEATVQLLNEAVKTQLINVINQMQLGLLAIWRDAAGHYYTVAWDPDMSEVQLSTADYSQATTAKLSLIQVGSVYSPSAPAAGGSARGLLPVSAGNVNPLDQREYGV